MIFRLPDKAFAAKAIYGLITVMALIVLMEDHPPTALGGAITLFGATLAIAIAEAYAEIIADTLIHERGLTIKEVRETLHKISPVLVGAQGPTLVFLASAFGLFSVETAIDVSRILVLALLFGYGLRVGQVLHKSRLMQVLSGLAMMAAGGIVVVIKALFH